VALAMAGGGPSRNPATARLDGSKGGCMSIGGPRATLGCVLLGLGAAGNGAAGGAGTSPMVWPAFQELQEVKGVVSAGLA